MKRSLCRVLLLSLVLTSCGGGGGGGSTDGNISPPPNSDTVSAIIGPAGGVLTTPSGKATVTIPSGALNNNTLITISASNQSDPPGCISNTYDFLPEGLIFSYPVAIKLAYDPIQVPPSLNETELILAYELDGTWITLDNAVTNVANHTVTGQIGHFSKYAVVSSSKLSFGSLIGEFNSVNIYSNYNVKNVSDDYNTSAGINTGMKWQCVEYVNRYYYNVYGKNIRIVGDNADDYYKGAETRGLEAHPNGGSIPPQIGDILVSEGDGSIHNVGHVAIVREVYNDCIYVAEQNYFNNNGDERHRIGIRKDGSNYLVANFGPSSSYPVRGWLRVPGSTVFAPTFTPTPGTYATGQSVTLSTTTPSATIRYTTDGSTPSDTVGTVYTDPIPVTTSMTIKAVAYRSGWTTSSVSTGTYTITGTVASPTFTPSPGTYATAQSVTLSTTTPSATIRYTTDDSTPSDTVGTVYTGPIAVSTSMTIKAVAYRAGWTTSSVSTGIYTITTSSGKVFEKHYGGQNFDLGHSVQQTADGGYIISGYTTQTDPRLFQYAYLSDALLIKVDSSGNQVFSKTYGGTGISEIEAADSVQQTSDGGYIIAGRTNDGVSSSGWNFYLLKADSSGTEIWHKAIDVSLFDYGYSVIQASDGGYIIAGTNGNSGIILVKTDSNGNSIWAKNLGGGIGYSVQQTLDGGYIVAGTSITVSEVFLVKTDSNGVPQWTKTYSGAYEGRSVQQTTDGGYVITGWGYVSGVGDEVYLIKTDPSGNQLWIKSYGGSGNERGYSVQQTADTGYIITGSTNSVFSNGGFDVYLIKTDSTGQLIWTRTFGGVADDLGYSVRQTSDGGYIVVGETYNFGSINADVYLIKTDQNGNLQ